MSVSLARLRTGGEMSIFERLRIVSHPPSMSIRSAGKNSSGHSSAVPKKYVLPTDGSPYNIMFRWSTEPSGLRAPMRSLTLGFVGCGVGCGGVGCGGAGFGGAGVTVMFPLLACRKSNSLLYACCFLNAFRHYTNNRQIRTYPQASCNAHSAHTTHESNSTVYLLL